MTGAGGGRTLRFHLLPADNAAFSIHHALKSASRGSEVS